MAKKQRYKEVEITINKKRTRGEVVKFYEDAYGHLMIILDTGGVYEVHHKREGERSFKFMSSSLSLETATLDVTTIIDDLI
jgi:hypothetical protein